MVIGYCAHAAELGRREERTAMAGSDRAYGVEDCQDLEARRDASGNQGSDRVHEGVKLILKILFRSNRAGL